VAEYLWNKLRNFSSGVADTQDNTLFIGELLLDQQGYMVPELEVFNTVTRKAVGKTSFIPYDGLLSARAAVTPDGKYLYVALSPDIIIIDTATQKAVGRPIPIVAAGCVAIAPNGKYAYAGDAVGAPNSNGVLFVIAISAQ
jgi:DNA-binding beta-propeller fold protein YncE